MIGPLACTTIHRERALQVLCEAIYRRGIGIGRRRHLSTPFLAILLASAWASVPVVLAQVPNSASWEVEFRSGDYAGSRRSATEACKREVSLACVALGRFELNGVGGAFGDPNSAIARFRTKCPQTPDACVELGFVVQQGTMMSAPAHDSAARLFTIACSRAWQRGCSALELARAYGRGVALAPDLARRRLTDLCSRGTRSACTYLGILLLTTRGGPPDFARADSLFERSCTLGDSRACAEWGFGLSSGRSRPRDRRSGDSVYQQACSGGSGLGCANRAAALVHGYSGIPDTTQGLAIARQWCALGTSRACFILALGALYGWQQRADTGVAVASFERTCRLAWLADACDLASQVALARGDTTTGNRFASRACELDVAQACFRLAYDLDTPDASPRRLETALQFYAHSCALRDAAACFNSGRLELERSTVKGSKERATAYFRRACELGEAQGCTQAERLNGSRKQR